MNNQDAKRSPGCSESKLALAAPLGWWERRLEVPQCILAIDGASLGVAFGVPMSLPGSASHSWSTRAASLWDETKLEFVFRAVMGPDSPSSEGNNLETHLLGTSGTQCQQLALQSCSNELLPVWLQPV